MKIGKVLLNIGTYAAIGAVSLASAALWTNVLEDRVKRVKNRVTQPKSNNVIEFKKARRTGC